MYNNDYKAFKDDIIVLVIQSIKKRGLKPLLYDI
jgi:hypothetical protein